MSADFNVLQIRFSDWRSVHAMVLDLPFEERTRAAAFQNAAARDRFVICRWVLRQALRQRGVPQWDQSFLSQNGKPYLANGPQFSISHTLNWGLIAVSDTHEVGIDIEAIKPRPHFERLAKRVFSLSERLALSELPHSQQAHFFYTIWTRKEAVVKVVAGSIFRARDLTVLSAAPGWRSVKWAGKTLWVQDLLSPDGYRAAVAVQRVSLVP